MARFRADGDRRRYGVGALTAALTTVATLIGLTLFATGSAAVPTCTTSWTNPGGGDWFTGSNWDNGVPLNSDHACLPNLGGAYTVTMGLGDIVDGVTVESDATLVLAGGPANVTLTAATEVLNNGTIQVTTSATGFSWLNSNGTINNNGTVQVGPSIGSGTHNIYGNGTFNNAGTLDIDVDLSSVASNAGFVNTGTVDIASGATWTNNIYDVDLNSGSITGDGTLRQDDPFNWNAGDITASVDVQIIGEPVTMTGVGSGGFTATGAGTIEGTINSNQSVEIYGGAVNTTLGLSADLQNDGTIEIFTDATGFALLDLNDFTLTNNGTTLVREAVTTGLNYIYDGNVVNNGLLDLDGDLLSNSDATSVFDNFGTIDIAAGKTWNNDTFDVNLEPASSVTGGGLLDQDDPLNWNGGSIGVGTDIDVVGEPVTMTGVGSGEIELLSVGTLGGTIGANQSVVLSGGAVNTTIGLSADLTNNGTLELFTDATGFTFLDLNGLTLTNNALVHLAEGGGTGGVFVYDGNVDNTATGTYDIDTNLGTTGGSTGQFTTTGTVDIATGTTWNNLTQEVTLNGGTIEGGGTLIQDDDLTWNDGDIVAGTLVSATGEPVSIAGLGSGEVEITSSSTLSGQTGAGQTVRLKGGAVNTSVALAGDFTNGGTILLETDATGFTFLNLAAFTLTNDGTVQSGPSTGAGGQFLYGGDLVNNGLVDLQADLGSTSGALGTVTNNATGVIDVDSGFVWTLNTMSMVSNGGTGTGDGTLAFGANRDLSGSGNYAETVLAGIASEINPDGVLSTGDWNGAPSSDVNIDIDGGGTDRLAVNGLASLDGDLNIDFGTYQPVHCDLWNVVAWDTVSGAFDNINVTPGLTIGGIDIAVNIQADGIWLLATDPLDTTPCNIVTPGGASLLEGDSGSTVVQVSVSLSNPASEPVTVDWATFDNGAPGVATPGVDYSASGGTVTFLPGEVTKTIDVTVFGDTIDEPPAVFGEWAVLTFSNVSPNATLDLSFFGLAVVIIIDDDPPPTIMPGVAIVNESDAGPSGSVVAELPVTLSNPSAETITVDWATLDTGSPGIATAGADYIADADTLTFLPGETSKLIPITVLGDTIDEPPALLGEWLPLAFSNASPNASIDNSFFGLGVIVIVDDDP